MEQDQITITAKEMEFFIKLQEKDEKAKAYAKRSAAKQALLAKKAKERGLTVSEAEIDDYLKKQAA